MFLPIFLTNSILYSRTNYLSYGSLQMSTNFLFKTSTQFQHVLNQTTRIEYIYAATCYTGPRNNTNLVHCPFVQKLAQPGGEFYNFKASKHILSSSETSIGEFKGFKKSKCSAGSFNSTIHICPLVCAALSKATQICNARYMFSLSQKSSGRDLTLAQLSYVSF